MGIGSSDEFDDKVRSTANKHESITWTDAEGNLQHAETQAEKAKWDKFIRDRQFRRDELVYDKASREFRDSTFSDFRKNSEYQAAQGVGGVNAAAGLAGMRRGLGDEFATAQTADANTRLRSQVLSGVMSFEQSVNALAAQDKLNFVKHKIQFFEGLQTMRYQADLSMELARFQAQLQSDLNSQQIFGDMLGVAGTVLGMKFFDGPGLGTGSGNGAGGIRAPF